MREFHGNLYLVTDYSFQEGNSCTFSFGWSKDEAKKTGTDGFHVEVDVSPSLYVAYDPLDEASLAYQGAYEGADVTMPADSKVWVKGEE